MSPTWFFFLILIRESSLDNGGYQNNFHVNAGIDVFGPCTICFSLFAILVIKYSLLKYFDIFLNEELLTFLLGLGIGYIVRDIPWYQEIQREFTVGSPVLSMIMWSCGVYFRKILFIQLHDFSSILLQTLCIVIPGYIVNGCIYWIFIKYVFNFEYNLQHICIFFMTLSKNPLGLIIHLKELGHQHARWVRIINLESVLTLSLVVNINFFIRIPNILFESIWIVVLWWLLHLFIGVICGCIVGFLTIQVMNILNRDIDHMRIIYLTVAPLFEYLNEHFIHTSSCGFFFGLGMTWNHSKHHLFLEQNRAFKIFWNIIHVTVSNIIMMDMGLSFSMYRRLNGTSPKSIGYAIFLKVIALYLALQIARLITIFLLKPVLEKITFCDLKNLIMICYCNCYSEVSILFLHRCHEFAFIQGHCDELYIIFTMLFVLSNIFNTPFVPLVSRMLTNHIFILYSQRNMRLVFRHILEMVQIKINVIKRRQIVAPLNWKEIRKRVLYVNSETQKSWFKNKVSPGDSVISLEEDEDLLLRDYKRLIMKTLRMYYKKQYERGLASPNVMRILKNALNSAIYSSHNKDLKVDHILNVFDQKTCLRPILTYLLSFVEPIRNMAPPKNLFGRIVFEFSTWSFYVVIMESLVITDIVLYLYFLLTYITPIMIFHIWYYLISGAFILEIFFDVIARSRDGYLKALKISVWKMTLFNFLCVVLIVSSWFVKGFAFIGLVSVILMLRLMRLVMFIVSLDNELVFKYYLGQIYINGLQHTLKLLPDLCQNPTLYVKLHMKIVRDIKNVSYRMISLSDEHPWVPITVKTKDMARIILNNSISDLGEMKITGRIDSSEFRLLNASIEERIGGLSKYKKPIHPLTIEEILENVSWMLVLDIETRNNLLKCAQKKTFYPSQVILQDGSHIDGIYVIATGIVEMNYIVNEKVLANLRLYGEIPIIENCPKINFLVSSDHYLISKNTFGELGLATGRSSDCTIKAHNLVVCYLIPKEHITSIFKTNISEKFRLTMFKHATLHMSYQLLAESRSYVTHKEDLYDLLRRSFIPDLKNCKVFKIKFEIEEVILLEGLAMDVETEKIFFAPCCIPTVVEKLALPKSNLIPIISKVGTKILMVSSLDAAQLSIFDEEADSTSDNKSMRTLIFSKDGEPSRSVSIEVSGKRKRESFRDIRLKQKRNKKVKIENMKDHKL